MTPGRATVCAVAGAFAAGVAADLRVAAVAPWAHGGVRQVIVLAGRWPRGTAQGTRAAAPARLITAAGGAELGSVPRSGAVGTSIRPWAPYGSAGRACATLRNERGFRREAAALQTQGSICTCACGEGVNGERDRDAGVEATGATACGAPSTSRAVVLPPMHVRLRLSVTPSRGDAEQSGPASQRRAPPAAAAAGQNRGADGRHTPAFHA
jgi:hypothetical protein